MQQFLGVPIKCNGVEIREARRIRYKCNYGQRGIRIPAVWDIIDILEDAQDLGCLMQLGILEFQQCRRIHYTGSH